MEVLKGLQPARVFHYFEEISGIPRGSGNTGPISDYLAEFARHHELESIRDAADNVILFGPASPGYEDAPAVILQGHCDMVTVKEPSLEHDFLKDGLRLKVEGGRITAEGTSLGADDGIALAYCLAILEAEDVLHPPLEVVLTSSEEIGLAGASRLDVSCLRGRYLLNLDYSTEGILLAGCAGGLNVSSCFSPETEWIQGMVYRIEMAGLKGGHSGVRAGEIHANACVLIGRLLAALSKQLPFWLVEAGAGEQVNVIPESARIRIALPEEDRKALETFLQAFQKKFRKEFGQEEEDFRIHLAEEGVQKKEVLKPAELEKMVCFLLNAPDGVQKMSGIQEGLVETSVNLGVFCLESGRYTADFGIRSAYDHVKQEVSNRIEALTQCLGGDFCRGQEYPAWEYREESGLRRKMTEVYEEMFGKKPEITLVHAGLECGYFSRRIPDLDCISFAPSIYELHSVRESLDILSVDRMWKYLKRVLESFCTVS